MEKVTLSLMDELKRIDDYTYLTLGKLLFETVIDYRMMTDSRSYFAGGYSFMNQFALTLADEIRKDQTSTFVKQSFAYVNMIGESNNLEVVNILRIGILEILYTEGPVVKEFTKSQLSDKGKSLWVHFSKFYL
jgi:hypothetical protein